MIQRGDSAGFPLEAFAELLGTEFDRHHAVEACVAGPVDFTPPSRANERENLVGTEAASVREAHHWIPAVQLITTVAGEALASLTGTVTRKRWPLAATAKRPKRPAMRVSKSGWGAPT